MKRLLSLFLAVLLLVSAVPVFAAGAGEVRVPDVSGLPGALVTVPVILNDNQGLVSMMLTVDYDSRLELIDVKDSGLLPGGNHKPELTNPYTLSWENDTATKNYLISGTVATLYFRIPASAQPGTEYAVSLSYDYDNYEVFDKDQNPVSLTCIPGTVTVSAPTALTIENAPETLVGGKTVTLKAGFDGASSAVTWSVRSADSAYASIDSKGKLTTKAVPAAHTVQVNAISKDGTQASAQIRLLPKVTAVSLTPAPGADGVVPVDLRQGNTLQLTANLRPAAASPEGTWKSSSTAVAKVSDGLVTFQKAGLVTITFTAADGSKKSASVKLRAGIPVTDLSVTGAETLLSGGKTTLKAEVNPDASLKTLAWSVSDPALASVTSKGAVTAKTVYEETPVTVTARATDGSGVTASHTVTLTPKANVIPVKRNGQVVNGTTLSLDLQEGGLTLTAPEDSTWASSNKSVAAVEDGVVTFKKAGTVTITAKLGKATGKVQVKISRLVEGLTISVKSGNPAMTSGKGKVTLKATPTNADASNKTVTWSSSNPAVASVSSSGAVTAKAGVSERTEVIITAKAKDGSGKEASFPVTVIPAAEAVSVIAAEALTTQDGLTVEPGEILSGRTLTLPLSKGIVPLASVVYPEPASDTVTWKSSSAKIASVDAGGNVILLKKGTVTITVTAADGSAGKTTVKLKIV